MSATSIITCTHVPSSPTETQTTAADPGVTYGPRLGSWKKTVIFHAVQKIKVGFRPFHSINVILLNICKYLTYEMVWCRFWQSDRCSVRWDHWCASLLWSICLYLLWFDWQAELSLCPIGWQCGQREERSMKVVGGALSAVERHPWMAAVFSRRSRGRTFTCGGSLISPCWVLTAAHCFPDGSVHKTNRTDEKKVQTCQCVPPRNFAFLRTKANVFWTQVGSYISMLSRLRSSVKLKISAGRN